LDIFHSEGVIGILRIFKNNIACIVILNGVNDFRINEIALGREAGYCCAYEISRFSAQSSQIQTFFKVILYFFKQALIQTFINIILTIVLLL
jgi:hypothetical protein